jgi:hypothetical protein
MFIDMHHGSVAVFLHEMGYGPHGKNLTKEYQQWLARLEGNQL